MISLDNTYNEDDLKDFDERVRKFVKSKEANANNRFNDSESSSE
jgi:NAD-dependent DNA ligase